MTKRKLENTGLIFGLIATLMLFVGPFIIEFLFEEYKNDNVVGTVYFVMFLLFTYIGNVCGEKSKKYTIQDDRDDKLNEILK